MGALRSAIRTAKKDQRKFGNIPYNKSQLIEKIREYQASSTVPETGQTAPTRVTQRSNHQEINRPKRLRRLLAILIVTITLAFIWLVLPDRLPFSQATTELNQSQTNFAIEGIVTDLSANSLTVFDIEIILAGDVSLDENNISVGDTIFITGHYEQTDTNTILLQNINTINILNMIADE